MAPNDTGVDRIPLDTVLPTPTGVVALTETSACADSWRNEIASSLSA